MCGIVGLHLKNPQWYPQLGQLLSPMLDGIASRGPDSAGIALYDEPDPAGHVRLSVRGEPPLEWEVIAANLSAELEAPVNAERCADTAVLSGPVDEDRLISCLREIAREVVPISVGRAMQVYKDVGAPLDMCQRYGVPQRAGYQGIGHTRMATESAVTPEHSHPFAPMTDFSLVHNGMFSNPAMIRRRLEKQGIGFDTDNDTEVAARYLAHQLSQGAELDEAFRRVLKELDGFYTLLVATETQFAIMRDAFACKPAVVAETDDYVAVASEYHALATLPGIDDADVFEPMPEEVHIWSR